jgi:membrane protease subunit HflC
VFGHHHHHHGDDEGHGHGHGHDHGHDHGHHHGPAQTGGEDRLVRLRRAGRFAVAGLIVAVAFSAACLTVVEPGEALVVTAFGNPVRVLTEPGLALRWPAPFEASVPVDVRLRTTSTGLHDVGTRDGLRILVQAYVEWRVKQDPGHITQYLRAVRNAPDEAAEQLRSYVGSSLEIAAARFDLAQLVNTDPARVQLAGFEAALKARLESQVLATYGISIVQVGIERLTLPGDTLLATVSRMTAERNTVAARVGAEGDRAAAKVRSDADRDARIVVADARAEAARVEAKSRLEAAGTYASAYQSAPALYTMLRSLDTLDGVVGDNTRLILRTDAAPFRAFVDGPGAVAATTPAPAALPGAGGGQGRASGE